MPEDSGSKPGHLAELPQVLSSLFPFSLAVAAAALAWSRALRSHLPVSRSFGKVQGDPLGSSSAGRLRAPRLRFRGRQLRPLPRNGEAVGVLGWERRAGGPLKFPPLS